MPCRFGSLSIIVFFAIPVLRENVLHEEELRKSAYFAT